MADITKILLRRDSEANWQSVNPILGLGEPGVAIDENGNIKGFKIGDGNTTWDHLAYQTGNFSAMSQRVEQLETSTSGLADQLTNLSSTVGNLDSLVTDPESGIEVLANKVSAQEGAITSNTSDISDLKTNKEDISNKVSQLSSESTDTQYLGAKCVFDLLEAEAHARDAADTNLTNDINGLETNVEALNLRIPAAPTQPGEYRLVALSTIQGTKYKWEAQPSIITFTVGETACLAQNGMRWEEYIQSIYNNGFILHEDDNKVWNGLGDIVEYNNTPINKTDVIISTGIYALAKPQE